MIERPHRQGYREALKRALGMRQRYLELAAIVAMSVSLPATLARSQGQILDRLAVASQPTPERLVLARKLVSEVERSPSAYLPELRAKLEQARSVTRAALEEDPRDAEAIKLLARIDSLLAQLAPRRRPEHPTEAEADAALDRLEGLVKGGGARREVEAAHTHLRKLIPRVKAQVGDIGRLYEARAEFLWKEYSGRLGLVRDVCPDCPVLNLAALAKGFSSARLRGAGDYTLDIVEEMHKQGYAPLVTGDFSRDGAMDVVLIGSAERQKKRRLFLLIASAERSGGYRALFLKALESKKAALTVRDARLILSEDFYAGDDFWFVVWNGKTFDFRYDGDATGKKLP